MNNQTLILVNEESTLTPKVLKYNFKGAKVEIIPDSYTPFDREALASKINKEYKQVIFYGYENQFYLLLPLISKKVVKKYIIDIGLPQLVKQHYLSNYLQVLEYKERGLIDFIATTRYDLYTTFKDLMEFIVLDYKDNTQEKTKECIGVLNEYYLEASNFYNELSAISISSIKCAKILNQNNITKKFGMDFGIELIEEPSIEKLVYGNKVNLDCKFCDVSPVLFIMSMDAGIPCIVGNTNLLDDEPELKKFLALDSDDNVNEIKDKIENAITNKDTIMKCYPKWRKGYTKKSQETTEKFIRLGGF